MKCPVCKGEKTILFMDKQESCFVCKGRGELEIPRHRLEKHFSGFRERVKERRD